MNSFETKITFKISYFLIMWFTMHGMDRFVFGMGGRQ